MLVDQNYAMTMTRAVPDDEIDDISYYVGAWIALATVWQVSTIAGALLGPFMPASGGSISRCRWYSSPCSRRH